VTSEANVIIELARDGALDRNLRTDPPPSVSSGRVVLDHLKADENGRLEVPEGGEVVLSVLSPETLRERLEVEDAITGTDTGGQPPVIVVEAAEYLREDELSAVLDAAERVQRAIILRIMADA
jgi:hypothetical protein